MNFEEKNETPFKERLVDSGVADLARHELKELENNPNFVIRQSPLDELQTGTFRPHEEKWENPLELVALFQRLFKELTEKYGISAPINLVIGKNAKSQDAVYAVVNKIQGRHFERLLTGVPRIDYDDSACLKKLEDLYIRWLEYFFDKYKSGDYYLSDLGKNAQYVYGKKLPSAEGEDEFHFIDADIDSHPHFLDKTKKGIMTALKLALSSVMDTEKKSGNKLTRARGAFESFFQQLAPEDREKYQQEILSMDRKMIQGF